MVVLVLVHGAEFGELVRQYFSSLSIMKPFLVFLLFPVLGKLSWVLNFSRDTNVPSKLALINHDLSAREKKGDCFSMPTSLEELDFELL